MLLKMLKQTSDKLGNLKNYLFFDSTSFHQGIIKIKLKIASSFVLKEFFQAVYFENILVLFLMRNTYLLFL